MTSITDRALKEQLRQLDEQLTSMIAVADEQSDFLLGALLCDAHAHVVKQYSESRQDNRMDHPV